MSDATQAILCDLLAESDAIWLPALASELPAGPGALGIVRNRGYFALQGVGVGSNRALQYQRAKMLADLTANGLARKIGRRHELTPLGFREARKLAWPGTGELLLEIIARLNQCLENEAYIVNEVGGGCWVPETRIAGTRNQDSLDFLAIAMLPLLTHGFLASSINPKGLTFYRPANDRPIDPEGVENWVDMKSTGEDFNDALAKNHWLLCQIFRDKILASDDSGELGCALISCGAEMRDATRADAAGQFGPLFKLNLYYAR